MAVLKQYPDYKDSGLPFLGKVPLHWELLRAKYIFREVDIRSKTGEETHLSMSQKHGLIESSKISNLPLQSESYIGGKLCKKNDLVLNRLKAHLGVFAHAPKEGVVSPDYSVFHIIRDGEVRFFKLVLKTPTYISELHG
jgi:type I restriction enzyme S subunit